MYSDYVQSEGRPTNPLDLVEHVVAGKDWAFDRRADDEMAVEVPGQWCDLGLFFSWSEELSALHFSCTFDLRVPPARRGAVYELLARLNERLWMGHFGLWSDEGVPMFRHSCLVVGGSLGIDQVQDLVDAAVAECDRYYPAFQFVLWGGKSAEDAMAAALLDTVGEA